MGQDTEMLLELAQHNKTSNGEMLKVLEQGLEDPWNFKLPGYHFKTLGAILDHVYVVDINWMHHLQSSSRHILTYQLGIEPLDHNARHFGYYADYLPARLALDQGIVDFFQHVKEAVEGHVVPWLPAIHLFNHQAHHRGQVSHILDALGIENDYSSIIRL